MSGAAVGKTVFVGDADNKALFATQRVRDILLDPMLISCRVIPVSTRRRWRSYPDT